MPPLGNLRTVTNLGDEWVEGEEHHSELYRRSEPQGRKGNGVRMNGFEHKLGPQPTIEEINDPAPKKKSRKPRAKKDPAIEAASTKDLKTRGIK